MIRIASFRGLSGPSGRRSCRAPAFFPAALLAASSPAIAQDLEPRAYAPTPVGMQFVLAGYGYSTGNVLLDAASPIRDAEITTHAMFAAYARTFEFAGDSAKFDLVIPFADSSGSATLAGVHHGREVSGFGNPSFRFAWNFIGAPAMTLAELQQHEPDWIVGASLRTTLPIGQYDEDKLLNIGTNRWSFKPELGASKTWGCWTFELSASGTFFTDNDDYFNGNTLEKEPVYALQGHLIRSIGRGPWIGLDATWYSGGRTTVNGLRNHDREDSTRLGLTFSLPVSRHQSFKLFASTGTTTRVGGDFTTAGIVWQYRWGGGI